MQIKYYNSHFILHCTEWKGFTIYIAGPVHTAVCYSVDTVNLTYTAIWLYQPRWKCKLATVTSWKADVSSVSHLSFALTFDILQLWIFYSCLIICFCCFFALMSFLGQLLVSQCLFVFYRGLLFPIHMLRGLIVQLNNIMAKV